MTIPLHLDHEVSKLVADGTPSKELGETLDILLTNTYEIKEKSSELASSEANLKSDQRLKAEIDLIISLRAEGRTLCEIAEQIKRSPSTVFMRLKIAPVVHPPIRGKSSRISNKIDAETDLAIQLRLEEKTYNEIAKELNLSDQTVANRLKAALLTGRLDKQAITTQSQQKRVRQAEIIKLIDAGYKYKEVADMLGVTRQRIYLLVKNYYEEKKQETGSFSSIKPET